MTTIAQEKRELDLSQYFLKRLLDYSGSLLGLIMLSPVFLVVAILIYKEDKGPIFYYQPRVGKDGKVFNIFKFRSMVVNADKLMTVLEVHNESKDGVMFKISCDPRVTNIGKFIRKYSVDELPQLINVLKGELSLIGPRPFSIRDYKRMPKEYRYRNTALPGITGLWQVSCRNENMDIEHVYQMDKYYIDNWSFWFDTIILFRTIQVVLFGKGC